MSDNFSLKFDNIDAHTKNEVVGTSRFQEEYDSNIGRFPSELFNKTIFKK